MEIELNKLEIDRALRSLLRNLRDSTDLAALIGEEMTQAVDDRFRNEVDPDGSPWATLSPAYVASKQRKGFNRKILQMRGDMRAKVAYQAYPDRVEIGTNTPYARRQHDKRPFIYSKRGGLGARDQARIEQVAEEYLQSLLNR